LVGISLLGGAIIREPESGTRHNTAILFDRNGKLAARYRKVHLPHEEGFWEAAHYQPGDEPPKAISGFGLDLGIQICSDANRTFGCQLLAAQGAAVILVPRATPASSYERWRLVLRADAVTSAAWVVSVNRPGNEAGVDVDGPSVVISPDGRVVLETTDSLAVVDIDSASVARARKAYPGYLPFASELYARSWNRLRPVRADDIQS
jgi:N-carbamoylputrescine amidase